MGKSNKEPNRDGAKGGEKKSIKCRTTQSDSNKKKNKK